MRFKQINYLDGHLGQQFKAVEEKWPLLGDGY